MKLVWTNYWSFRCRRLRA